MVRNGMRNTMKDIRSINSGSKMLTDCFRNDYISGFSWPPRSYSCSFCKRDFKSAQALGGHMNVHRRDRARLRHSSPNPNPNPNQKLNPNPNFSSPSEMKNWNVGSTLPDSSSSRSSSFTQIMGVKSDIGVGKLDRGVQGDGSRILKKDDIVNLDLEIGLLSHSKEDLDLELRLGYL